MRQDMPLFHPGSQTLYFWRRHALSLLPISQNRKYTTAKISMTIAKYIQDMAAERLYIIEVLNKFSLMSTLTAFSE